MFEMDDDINHRFEWISGVSFDMFNDIIIGWVIEKKNMRHCAKQKKKKKGKMHSWWAFLNLKIVESNWINFFFNNWQWDEIDLNRSDQKFNLFVGDELEQKQNTFLF